MSVFLLLMELAAQAAGQTPMPVPQPNPPINSAPPYVAVETGQIAQTIAAPPTVPGPLPDPTNPSGPFKDMLKPKSTTGPAAAANRTPVIALRARVLAPGKEPSAMLEIDGKLALVYRNSVIAFGSAAVRIFDINAQEVRVEMASTKETFSIR